MHLSSDIWFGDKRKMKAHIDIGGTYVVRLAAGDRVAIAHSKDTGVGFIYPAYGDSVLTFRGELIAVSNKGA